MKDGALTLNLLGLTDGLTYNRITLAPNKSFATNEIFVATQHERPKIFIAFHVNGKEEHYAVDARELLRAVSSIWELVKP